MLVINYLPQSTQWFTQRSQRNFVFFVTFFVSSVVKK